jgi:hypothetical protein
VAMLLGLSACSTTKLGTAQDSPETVLVAYHARAGKEAELQAAILRAWDIYKGKSLVFARPHVILKETEDGDKIRFVEIFTWVSHAGPAHAPDSVKAIWQQELLLCEDRDGHHGIDGGEVSLVTPAAK